MLDKPKAKNPTDSSPNGDPSEPFWRTTALVDMTPAQWESLCDGCGRCCLEKLEDFYTHAIHYTDVACAMLDLDTCRCTNYAERHRFMPDCVPLTPDNIADLRWMPSTCAYRMLADGKDLADWHPLISGDPQTVIDAGISVKGRATPSSAVDDLEDHVVTWPE